MKLTIRRTIVEARQVPELSSHPDYYREMDDLAQWCHGLVCNIGTVISVCGQVARAGDWIVEDIVPGRYVVREATAMSVIYTDVAT